VLYVFCYSVIEQKTILRGRVRKMLQEFRNLCSVFMHLNVTTEGISVECQRLIAYLTDTLGNGVSINHNSNIVEVICSGCGLCPTALHVRHEFFVSELSEVFQRFFRGFSEVFQKF
jgi:hypothetical protein